MKDERPKPASFGFDADFSDLSGVKPTTRAASPIAVRPNAKKNKFRPKTATEKSLPKSVVLTKQEELADDVARSMGFASREQKGPVLKKRRRTHHDEPVDQLSIRGPVRVLNEFITYCENEHLSYWEAMEKLLQK